MQLKVKFKTCLFTVDVQLRVYRNLCIHSEKEQTGRWTELATCGWLTTWWLVHVKYSVRYTSWVECLWKSHTLGMSGIYLTCGICHWNYGWWWTLYQSVGIEYGTLMSHLNIHTLYIYNTVRQWNDDNKHTVSTVVMMIDWGEFKVDVSKALADSMTRAEISWNSHTI